MRTLILLCVSIALSTAGADAAGRWLKCYSPADSARLIKISYKLALHIANTGDRQCHKVGAILGQFKDFTCESLGERPPLGRTLSTNSLVVAQVVSEDPADDLYAETPHGFVRLPRSKQDIAEAFEHSRCQPEHTNFFSARHFSNGVILLQ
ncbi:MAG: hypothetical protein AAF441_15085 [Pseudomonadota bacterium]